MLGLNNKISAEVELEVRRPPIISDNSTRSLVVNEGQPVKLECYAGGFPLPRVSWRRENNAILPTGGSIYRYYNTHYEMICIDKICIQIKISCFRGNILKLPAITKEDRGTYYCVAENGVGRGARRNIAIEVEFAPVITVPKPRLGQALQYDMDLECHVEAYPPPAIVWLNNGVQLTNNQHYRYTYYSIFGKNYILINILYFLSFLFNCLEYHILLLQMNSQIPRYVLLQLRNVNTVIISVKHLMYWEQLKLL